MVTISIIRSVNSKNYGTLIAVLSSDRMCVGFFSDIYLELWMPAHSWASTIQEMFVSNHLISFLPHTHLYTCMLPCMGVHGQSLHDKNSWALHSNKYYCVHSLKNYILIRSQVRSVCWYIIYIIEKTWWLYFRFKENCQIF